MAHAATDPRLASLADDAIVWASQHGLVVGLGAPPASAPACALVHAPLSVLPVAFPEARFEQAVGCMQLFSGLVDAVARDEDYLEQTLAQAAAFDDFTARLLSLLRDSRPARRAAAAAGREVVLGIHRSDYMLDGPSGGFLQVELNTIASSFACLSTLTGRMHRHLIGRAAGASDAARAAAEALAARLPVNKAMEEIAAAMAAAVEAAGGGVVLMVVQPGERNAYDQQWLQQTLWAAHGVRTVRLTLAQVGTRCEVEGGGGGGELRIRGEGGSKPQRVGLVYFRAGYAPGDYPSEAEWAARLLIERSAAAKCPTAAYQLAGSKKIQQALAALGAVERFVGEEGGAALRGLFAGLWSLDDPSAPETAAVIAEAIASPERFVLKPQREGGGNNLYGEELVARLRQGGPGLGAFILMQRILPPPQRSVLLRNGAWAEEESLSELGIYGTFLRKGEEVLLNRNAGHLVRTKTSTSNEGGVAAGFAVLDSPLLARPGEGLLPAELEGGGPSAPGAAAGGGGVLAAVLRLMD
ncbi:glutathione synthetase [Raphidocelis subcapitata]|uniref:Glutathione synthetase n=1 Tax=Raphidocelis subcapitata TaxID=307507 RepID=A0A2V0P6P9_9CHLO|nr:glutathione synthetase [Raphidocelis subcapitata]|eukprot:GBF95516.1 glutathione synthetase [Raphidocelis subcapitata]